MLKKVVIGLGALASTVALPTAAQAEWWRGQPVPFLPCATMLAFGQVWADLPCRGWRAR